MRKKLIELLSINTCPNTICNFCEHFKNKRACEKHVLNAIADHLIANGVTIPVRCKECEYWKRATVNKKGFLICPASGMEITADDFCSYGERRTDDKETG